MPAFPQLCTHDTHTFTRKHKTNTKLNTNTRLLELRKAGVAFPVGKICRRGRDRDAYGGPMFVFFVCVCFVIVFVILLFCVFVC